MTIIFFLLLLAGLFELGIGFGQCRDVLQANASYEHVTGTFRNPGPYSMFISIILPIAWYYAAGIHSFLHVEIRKKFLITLSSLYVVLALWILPLSMSRTS